MPEQISAPEEETKFTAAQQLENIKIDANVERMNANQDRYEVVDAGGNKALQEANEFDEKFKAAQAELQQNPAEVVPIRHDLEDGQYRTAA